MSTVARGRGQAGDRTLQMGRAHVGPKVAAQRVVHADQHRRDVRPLHEGLLQLPATHVGGGRAVDRHVDEDRVHGQREQARPAAPSPAGQRVAQPHRGAVPQGDEP
nr:hypothetical protein [Fodinicola feengrottensis]